MTETPPSRTPAIIGFLMAGALILGVSFFVSSRDRDRAPDNVPPIRILAPADGDTVTDPITIIFATPGELHLDPGMGWMAGDLHLHAMLNGREVMPAATDIAARDSVYQWRLPASGTGPYRIYLTWAGRHHGNLRGTTDTVQVHVGE